MTKYLLSGGNPALSLRRHTVVVFNILLGLLSYYFYTVAIEMRTSASSWYLEVAPNFLAVYITCGFLALTSWNITAKDALGVACGVSLYEILQLWIPERTFDVKDIVASLVAGLLLYALNKWLNDNMARKKQMTPDSVL